MMMIRRLAWKSATTTARTSGLAGIGLNLKVNGNGARWKSTETAPVKEGDERFVGLTGAQIFHELMADHKVETIFGYPGGAILPVFDAIYESDQFKFILTRHEQGATHCAQAYARAKGKKTPGIVLVTSGPGATNCVTGLMDSLMDGVPLIVFTGQVPTAAMGSDAFQEADVVGITRACTKWNVLVKDVSELPRRINEAFEIATSGRPGPVLVDLPKDVTAVVCNTVPDSTPQTAVRMKQKVEIFHKERLGAPGEEEFRLIADMINNAKKPLIYAGQGIIQSKDAPALLKELAEKANIPVTTTLQGMGGFDERHPLSLKMLGMHGSAYANFAIQDADVILALGARFDDRVTGRIDTFAPEAKKAERENRGGIIHFEISPKNLHKVIDPTVAVLGDVGKNIEGVIPHLEYNEREEWFAKINNWKQKHPFKYVPAVGNETLKPQQVLEELNRQVLAIKEANPKQEVYISTGIGTHQMFAAQYITWTQPGECITSGGAGTMGTGSHFCIGSKIAKPDALCIDIDGDASFIMTCQELATAREFGVNCKILILNNNFQGMVRQWQELFYESKFSATAMYNPRFDVLAEAFGCKGMYVDKADDVSKVVKEFLDYDDGPVVLEAVVRADEMCLPMVPAGGSLSDMILEAPPKP